MYKVRYYAVLALLTIIKTIAKNYCMPPAAKVRVKRTLSIEALITVVWRLSTYTGHLLHERITIAMCNLLRGKLI